MILTFIANFIEIWKAKYELRDDDFFVDKIVRKFTVAIMLVFTAMIGVSKLVGDPHKCWCPNEYSDPKCEYGTRICYVTNFIVPASNSTDLAKRGELESHRILYYPWVIYIYMVQAFLFYLPSIVWLILHRKSNFDVVGIVELAKADKVDEIVSYFEQYVVDKDENRVRIKSRSMRLSLSYIFTKLFYLFIVFAQLILLNFFFNDEYHKKNPFSGWNKLNLADRFPRMVLCKFQVYVLHDLQTHWMQCVLATNVYIEKIFAIVWIWLWILALLIVVDLFLVLVKIIFPSRALSNRLLRDAAKQINITSDIALMFSLIKSNSHVYNVSKVFVKVFLEKEKTQKNDDKKQV